MKTNKQTRMRRTAPQPDAMSKELHPVFAAYINMARANLYSVLRYISVQCGLDVNQNEDGMHELPIAKFASNKRPETRQKAFLLLMRNIPVLQQMTQSGLTQGKPADAGKPAKEKHLAVEQEDLQRVLQNLIRVVNFKRNLFTHADHYDTSEEIEKELQREIALCGPLNTAFKGSKREVKRIFCYTEKDMNFVDQDEHMMRIPKKDNYGNIMQDEKGKDMYIFVERSDWYFRLYDTIPDPVTEMPLARNLTTAGLVFILCKLLHKKYATQFVQKTGLFRPQTQRGNSPFEKKENEVMFNVFCAHRIRLPKGRVESTGTDYALGLDILNELQKCPSELFDTLSPKDKEMFQVRRKDGETLPDPDDDINLFRRYGDRFPYFAMRYIDAMREAQDGNSKVLDDIVFQVSLGKYRFKFYNRGSLDVNEDRVRVLQKEVNGFGPIDKMEQKRKENYAAIIRPISDDPNHLYDADTANTNPYMTDQHAAYAITGNRIGITWNEVIQNPQSEEKRSSIRLRWPDNGNQGEDGRNRMNNLERLDNDKCFLPNVPTSTENIAPRAWLSVHDLPALIFLHLLGGDPETVIKDTYNRLVSLFKDIKDGQLKPQENKEKLQSVLLSDCYKLRLSDIPKKLQDYLSGTGMKTQEQANRAFINWVNKQMDGDDFEVGAIKTLQNRIEKFKQDLNTVGDKQNRIGRKGYVDIRPGSLAKFLTKDIVAMTRPDESRKNNGKPSGLDYGVLQAAIATFKNNGVALTDTPLGNMLRKAINVNNHPFLTSVLSQQISDTIDLYVKYQTAKLEFLRSLRDGKRGNYKDQWFLREAYRNHMAQTSNYVQGDKGLASLYLDTLQLPDGVFTNAICDQLLINEETKNNAEILAALADREKTGGVSHLINLYFDKILGDKPQTFYREMKRHYKVIDWAKYEPGEDNPVLLTTIPPTLFLLPDEIATLLRKGNADDSPIVKGLNRISNRLQKKISKKWEVPARYAAVKNEDKDDFFFKQIHQMRKLQKNERNIRRYRNQDLLLFVMAKNILLSGGAVLRNNGQVEQGIDQFKLQNILPPAMRQGNENDLLEQKVEFRLTINLNDENGKPIKDGDGQLQKRTISQSEIKIKNYGDFYTFLYDSRIGTLLSQLPMNGDIKREKLETEFDHYDRQRQEVFRLLQKIESLIIMSHPALADSNAGKPDFYDKEGKPYRNSFSSLLSLCKQYLNEGGKPTDVSCLLTEIRNAFSHNRYVKSESENLDIRSLSLPEVADHILNWLKNHKHENE